MFVGHFTVVADEVDDGVIGEVIFGEVSEDATDFVVDGGGEAIIRAEEVAGFFGVGCVVAHGDVFGIVHGFVVIGHDEWGMWGAVGDHGEEGAVVAGVEELDEVFGLEFGFEAFAHTWLWIVVAIKDAVEIFVAAIETDKIFKTEPTFGRNIAVFDAAVEMPFANITRAIAVVAKDFGEKCLVEWDGIMVGKHAVGMGVFAGHDGGAKGTAKWEGGVGVIEAHAFMGKPVDIWRVDKGIARVAHDVETHLVGVDDKDIG